MSAALLREAAAEMRERAEMVPEQAPIKADVMGVWLNSRYYLTTTPAVALAVADWLHAVEFESMTETGSSREVYDAAVTVARAYLGRDS